MDGWIDRYENILNLYLQYVQQHINMLVGSNLTLSFLAYTDYADICLIACLTFSLQVGVEAA